MEMKELIGIVEDIAPVTASLLGSPIAGAILGVIAHMYGAGNKFNLEQLAASIANNPAKLKEIENQHIEAMGNMLAGLIKDGESHMAGWVVGIITTLFAMGMVAFIIWDMYR